MERRQKLAIVHLGKSIGIAARSIYDNEAPARLVLLGSLLQHYWETLFTACWRNKKVRRKAVFSAVGCCVFFEVAQPASIKTWGTSEAGLGSFICCLPLSARQTTFHAWLATEEEGEGEEKWF